MTLWNEWIGCVLELRPACSRQRSFLWLMVVLAAMSIRSDMAGATSFIRSHWLTACCYHRVLHLFHSSAVDLTALTKLWGKLWMKLFEKQLLRVNCRVVLICDGIKAPKEGKKMPAVKSLHQESCNNTKPEYIMGHSCQVIAGLVEAVGTFFAVPLAGRIHEGLVFSNRDSRTILDKLVALLEELSLGTPVYLVADAYYACCKIAYYLVENKSHLVTRVRSNAVAYELAGSILQARRRGRPQKYGSKIQLRRLFDYSEQMKTCESPVYGEKGVILRYYVADLLWRPLGRVVRFVAVIHPTRANLIFLCTDLGLAPYEIIRLYGLRFKIEVSFKQSVHLLGTYAYHFWMKAMKPIRRGRGDQYMHRETKEYRDQVRRKMKAYNLHIQVGLIAQGLLQYLSVTSPTIVWRCFGSWLRTMNSKISPSEAVVAQALRSRFPEFLLGLPSTHILQIFLADKLDLSRCQEIRIAA